MWRLECDEGRQVWKFDGKQQDEGAAADEKAFLATFAKNKNSADRIYRRSVARKARPHAAASALASPARRRSRAGLRVAWVSRDQRCDPGIVAEAVLRR